MFSGTLRARLRTLLSLAATGLLTVGILALGVKRLTFDQVARDADSVFVGKVVDITTRWGEGRKMIWTDYHFDVQETWKGQPLGSRHVVSVAGGTHDGRTIIVTHVPRFDKGATYVLYAFDPVRLVGEATVGVEQGVFREVLDVESRKPILIDYWGYRMDLLQDGSLVRGPMTQRVEGAEKARVLSDEELVAMQKQFQEQFAHEPLAKPTYTDGHGRPLAAPATAPRPKPTAEEVVAAAPRGEPVSRGMLRDLTTRALGGANTEGR